MSPVSTAAVVAASVLASDVVAEPCIAHVHLAGTAAAIERVTGALRQLGVTTGPSRTGCRTVEANVELDPEGGIAVSVEIAGRTEARVVSDPAMAAAWLDSWVHDDAVLAPDALELGSPATRQPGHEASVERAGSMAAPTLLDRISLSAAYEQVWTDDGGSWSGGSVSACARLGAFCLGGRVRARYQSSWTVGLATASRNDVSVMAIASRAFEIGRVIASPEIGAGVGRMATARVDCTPAMMMQPNCPDPTDPMCSPDPGCYDAAGNNIYVGDNLHEVTYTPRVAAALRLALPLFDRVWLDVLAEVTFAPLAHSDPFPAQTAMGTTGQDDKLALPGEPTRAVQIGVGLRIGAP